jgi:N-acetylneuraminic acid mutarotase
VLVMSDGSTTARRFDPATSSWTTSTMSATRSLPTMTLLTDGRVLLAGGSSLNTAEIYNPDHNTWTTAAPMPSVRRSAVSALLDDGRVLAVSGFENAGEVNATEVFAP